MLTFSYVLCYIRHMKHRTRYKHELLQAAHDKADIHIGELCRELDISRTMYYKILNGRSGSIESVSQVAWKLGLNPKDVIDIDETAPSFLRKNANKVLHTP